MSPTAQNVRFHSWSAGGAAIRCSAEALKEIQAAARNGFLALRQGGMEVGGVLFGVHEGPAVQVLAQRPLSIEHAHGPGFSLSAKDETVLAALLERSRSDARLQGLTPVGWYVSHTRSGLALTERDAALFERHFPGVGQVAALLKPSMLERSEIAWFRRAPDGSIVKAEPHADAVAPAEPLKPVVQPTPQEPVVKRVDAVNPPSPPTVAPATIMSQPQARPRNYRRKAGLGTRSKIAAAVCALIVIGGVAGAIVWTRGSPSAAKAASLQPAPAVNQPPFANPGAQTADHASPPAGMQAAASTNSKQTKHSRRRHRSHRRSRVSSAAAR